MNKEKNVLFIKGIADNRQVKVAEVLSQRLIYSTGGSNNIYNNLKNSGFKKDIVTLDTDKNKKLDLEKYDLIFNQISDCDTHKTVLKKLSKIIEQSSKNIAYINHPKYIFQTTRDKIYKNLQNIPNLIVPHTVKITPKSPDDIQSSILKSKMNFPILFRQAGDHGGVSTILLNSYEEINSKMYQFALDGREYYITKYYDYSENGIYRKFRLVVVDGELFVRHVIYSNNWMIHSKSREFMEKNPQYNRKEKIILENFDKIIKPKIQNIINTIYNVLSLDYFGIDCGVDINGQMVIFELNSNMNILINNQYNKDKYIDKIKNAINKMILHRMDSL